MLVIKICEMMHGEETVVSEIVAKVFQKYIAPGYSNRGIEEFNNYLQPDFIERRYRNQNLFYLAKDEERVIGMIELKDRNHISLLFVDDEYHKKGIAKQLFQCVLERIKHDGNVVDEITVNSSPYAVDIYEKMGFYKIEEEQEKNGIRFIPMKLRI